jgi:hypothetical protein
MKALLLNMLLGIVLGRFFAVWSCLLFVPLIAAEVAYGVVVHDLSPLACLRRAAALLTTAEFAFLFGVLLRPAPNQSPPP